MGFELAHLIYAISSLPTRPSRIYTKLTNVSKPIFFAQKQLYVFQTVAFICENRLVAILVCLISIHLKNDYVIGITAVGRQTVRTWKSPATTTRGDRRRRASDSCSRYWNRWIAEKVIRLLLFCLVIALSRHTTWLDLFFPCLYRT